MQDSKREAEIARNLGVWFGHAARDLPWRKTRDPYHIWLSEVMLQQTRVDTVIPYYERFLARFPTTTALAKAPLDDVLALWSGLGYYSRARSLHRAAQEVVAHHNGELPKTAEALRDLSGIGPYTAGAIASIAFDAAEPLVDGNVARVLARVFAISADARSTEAQKLFWDIATRLVRSEANVPPSVLNQSLMELGALLCSPTKPGCGICPLAAQCLALKQNLTSTLPVIGPRAKPKPVSLVAAVVWHEGRVLLAQRSAKGLFGGLWEPPLAEAPSFKAGLSDLAPFGIDATQLQLVSRKPLRHILSHRSLSIHIGRSSPSHPPETPKSLPEPYVRAAMLDPSADGLGLSSLATKILAAAPNPDAPFVLSPTPSRPSQRHRPKT